MAQGAKGSGAKKAMSHARAVGHISGMNEVFQRIGKDPSHSMKDIYAENARIVKYGAKHRRALDYGRDEETP